ncbi:MAG: OB-fold nucleic acid binding domain-containing protein [Bacteroidetes bacterium]|nr:OB-fold nucleic acid binding domain-containing protein [Bacteroidota bacterium]
MRRTLVLIIGLFLLTASFALAQKKYSAAEAGDHVGQYGTIVGKVYQVYESRKGTIFLDIGGRYPNNPFTAVIFSREASNFSDVRQYQGKTVEVTGKIRTYQGTPEIILNGPDQITTERSSTH